MHRSISKYSSLIPMLGSLLVVTSPALAQGQQAPPKYLQIIREAVKPGRDAAHSELEAAWSQAFGKAKVPLYTLGMTTMFGPPEAWWLQGSESIAEIEKVTQAVQASPRLRAEIDRYAAADAANISGFTSVLARFLPDLSNPGDVDVAAMRVWEVVVFQVRPGYEENFAEAAKLYRSTVGQAKIDVPWATYAVMAGMPGPTYLVFLPHRTLAEIDPETGTGAAMEKAFNEEAQKKLASLAQGYSSTEELIFSVSPEMSNPSPEFIARDPKFWTPKPRAHKTRPATATPAQ
jgi:hypothetical protein